MPRFYFDGREGSRFEADEDGLEFPDQHSAELAAKDAAAAIAREILPKGNVTESAIELRDESGRRLLAVTVSMSVERFEEP